jgi:hypothetical protein
MNTEEDKINAMLRWEQSHRRDDGEFEIPTRGFSSPAGLPAEPGLLVWLPSTRAESRTTFDDDGNVRLESSPVTTKERVVAKLAAIRREMRISAPGRVVAQRHALLEFGAAMLLTNYKLTGTELGELLAGKAWHAPLIELAAGGEDQIEDLNGWADLNAGPIDDPLQLSSNSPPVAELHRRSPKRFRTVLQAAFQRIRGVH